MQNDSLFNDIMEKCIIIDILYDSNENPSTTLKHVNINPSLVMTLQPPFSAIGIVKWNDENFTGYKHIYVRYIDKDETNNLIYIDLDGLMIVGNPETETWEFDENI